MVCNARYFIAHVGETYILLAGANAIKVYIQRKERRRKERKRRQTNQGDYVIKLRDCACLVIQSVIDKLVLEVKRGC